MSSFSKQRVRLGPVLALVFAVSSVLAAAQPVPVEISSSEEGLSLRFTAQSRVSYLVESSTGLLDWEHQATLRGDGPIIWSLPRAKMQDGRRFFRIAPFKAVGVDRLHRWPAYVDQGGRFSIGLFGDSYTHAPLRYGRPLAEALSNEFGDLGPGFCGFGFTGTGSRNGAIDPDQLSYRLSESDWSSAYGFGFGPDACHITALSPRAALTITAGPGIEALRIHYVRSPGSGGFRYRVNQGLWRARPTGGENQFASLDIGLPDNSGSTEVDLEAIFAGVTLLGAEAVVQGDGVVVHKLSVTGGRAEAFMTNQVSKDAVNALGLDMAVIFFGTNEHAGNRTPASFENAVRNMIGGLREGSPDIDIVLVLPPYTMFESEVATAFSLQAYGERLKKIAEDLNGAYVDFTQVFGPATELQYLIDVGLMRSDRVHPTTGEGSGGQLIAETLGYEVLGLN
ncbi:MAG: SGNH/GDSL hydrolase family protein [Verrucomicrobiota bacterium]